MYTKTEKIWMDGKLVPWGDAKVHILTHTLHYGVGVFEGIRYYDCGAKGSYVFRLKEHMKRFLESCKCVALEPQYSRDQLVDACLATIRENGLKEGYLRPLAYIGNEPNLGLWAYDNDLHVSIATWGWGAYLGSEGVEKGIRARTSSYTRLHRNISMVMAKVTGQYVNSCLAKREAKLSGYDEALLLDTEGYVAEGTGENIFVIRNGVVHTPPLGSILEGITRNSVITLLREEGYEVIEQKLTRDFLYVADEIFLTGTAAEVTPIREVDNINVGNGKVGPVTLKTQKLYQDLIHGKLDRHGEWLEPVVR